MPIICLDAGHGGSDPGACCNGLRECDVALAVVLKTKWYLEAVGYTVVLTRSTDVDVAYPNASATEELQARCDISDRANADLFLSVHCNAVDNPQPNGVETYHYALSVSGQKFARLLQGQLLTIGGLEDRGVRTNPLYVTRHTDAVAALAELAFISNADDAAKLGSEEYQDKFAAALARGVTDYFAA